MQTFEVEYRKYCESIAVALRKNDLNKAFAGISVCAELRYQWNQDYVDPVLEEYEKQVSKRTGFEYDVNNNTEQKTILFYDGFGLDKRGLALIYLKALGKLDCNVVYVTISKAEGHQPEIDRAIQDTKIVKKYIPNGPDRLKVLYTLQSIIAEYQPTDAFFYSLPNDSVGVAAFMQMAGKTVRYLINLTDHAFWLGLNVMDYCIEFRSYGAKVSYHYRNIASEKLILLPFYPDINRNDAFQGFDFDVDDRPILFSGGALYKTIDSDLTYYHLVGLLLDRNPDLIFVYAGSGDDTHIVELKREYSGRVYHIPERKDLFAFMQHVTLYLSTYPITGGLMTQYAAAAGKIPVTLKFDSISDDFLIGQKSRRIEYDTVESVVEDVTRLLNDRGYLAEREKLLENSLSNEDIFMNQLGLVIREHRTDYEFSMDRLDTTKLRRTYRENFSLERFRESVSKIENLVLLPELLPTYLRKTLKRIQKK